MSIGLVDVDSHNYPNLVLMKLSAYYKNKGIETKLLKPDDILLGQNMFDPYEKLIGAVVFDKNKNISEKLIKMGVDVKGTGLSLNDKLPKEIEYIFPDYSLYGIKDTAYGFLTRGCPRGCKFCIVGRKEGLKSYKVNDLKNFWNGQKYVELLDPNILACKDHEELLKQVIDSKKYVNFNQGVDARLLTDTNIDMLSKIKIKTIHFAWDNPEDKVVPKMLEKFKDKTKFNKSKMRVYVLVNFNSTIQQDLNRIYKLREMDYDPYVMIFDKEHAPKQIKRMQRWVNNIFVWRKCERFEDYK
jgi:hypothetical protein